MTDSSTGALSERDQWRKKPVVISAMQWDGTERGCQALKARFPALDTLGKTGNLHRPEVTYWKIGTLEGGHVVSPGDWIIQGVKGEFYPCKPDIFEATYERAALASRSTEPGGEAPFAEVFAELTRAIAKFPTWPTDPLHALAVLGEEFGELTKDMLQMVYEPHKTSRENVRTEALQTAAMALRLFASLDAYEYMPGAQHKQALASTPPISAEPAVAQIHFAWRGALKACGVSAADRDVISEVVIDMLGASPAPAQAPAAQHICGICFNDPERCDINDCGEMHIPAPAQAPRSEPRAPVLTLDANDLREAVRWWNECDGDRGRELCNRMLAALAAASQAPGAGGEG